MNLSRLTRSTLGIGTVLTLAIGIGTSAVAGPSPQYWQMMEKSRAENAVRKVASAEKAKPAAMACEKCKTSVVTEFSPTNVSGKWAPHYTPVGSKHECSACGGTIARVRGKTANDMKANCPTCAKTVPTCCTLS